MERLKEVLGWVWGVIDELLCLLELEASGGGGEVLGIRKAEKKAEPRGACADLRRSAAGPRERLTGNWRQLTVSVL